MKGQHSWAISFPWICRITLGAGCSTKEKILVAVAASIKHHTPCAELSARERRGPLSGAVCTPVRLVTEAAGRPEAGALCLEWGWGTPLGGQSRQPTRRPQDCPTVRPASRPLCPQAGPSLGGDAEATQPTEARSDSGSSLCLSGHGS